MRMDKGEDSLHHGPVHTSHAPHDPLCTTLAFVGVVTNETRAASGPISIRNLLVTTPTRALGGWVRFNIKLTKFQKLRKLIAWWFYLTSNLQLPISPPTINKC
jgi:hypothetical protein